MSLFATLVLAPLLLASPPALAEEVVLRNDSAFDDTFDTSDNVAWLAYPECAISVLTPDPADLPLTIDTVQFYFGSSQGNQDGQDTLVQLGVQKLGPAELPTGPGNWAWGEEAFTATVTSTQLNSLNLDSPGEGLYPIELTEGRIAVWLCPPDPATGEGWPTAGALDTSGIVIDTGSTNAGNYLYYESAVYPLSALGAQGSWIIRAISDFSGGGGSGAGGGTGGGTGGGSGDGSGDGGGTGGDDGPVVVDSVTPSDAAYGTSADVVVLGSGFGPGTTATLGGLALGAIEVQGDTAFAARTPSALPVGVHDLVVTTGAGDQDTLIEAFAVTELDTGVAPADGGCGCAAPGLAGGWLLGLLAFPFVVARRRD